MCGVCGVRTPRLSVVDVHCTFLWWTYTAYVCAVRTLHVFVVYVHCTCFVVYVHCIRLCCMERCAWLWCMYTRWWCTYTAHVCAVCTLRMSLVCVCISGVYLWFMSTARVCGGRIRVAFFWETCAHYLSSFSCISLLCVDVSVCVVVEVCVFS